MLKKICGLFLGLVVLTGSACVTPTHASSAPSVVLVHVQAASPTSAKDEMVSIYNNSPNEVKVTNWCLKNKAVISFACLTPPSAQFEYYLPAYSFAVVATESFLTTHSILPEMVTKVFTITNQSSGSIVNSADTISLINETGQVIDTLSWSTAIPSGKVMMRTKSLTDPRVYETLDASLAWSAGALTQVPSSRADLREIPLVDQPDDPVEPSDTSDPDIPTEPTHPFITELLPDAEGSDTGKEFIELYNPTDTAIDLTKYKLRVGQNLEKTFTFSATSGVPAYGYSAFTNSQISFSLLNTASSIQLEYDGNLIGEKISYVEPPEAESWALIEGKWEYTNTPTPNVSNQASTLPSIEAEPLTENNTLKPCAANQYRSLETNRCRLLVTATSTTASPCKEGQVRNPDTNRCRNKESTTTSPVPCKAGQERSPETNRCRTITKMTNTNYGVKGAITEATPTSWYLWLGIGGVVALIIGYAVWEWREELKLTKGIDLIRQKFARIKR